MVVYIILPLVQIVKRKNSWRGICVQAKKESRRFDGALL